MTQLPLSVIGDAAVAHFLSTSEGALVVAVVASAVLGFIVWWAVALVVSFLGIALWRLRRRWRPGAARETDLRTRP
jgi:hypothetical protein